MPELYYGGDYNPEQWSPEVWAEDMELMRRAGVNLATVGVFSWSSLEPEPGRYEFGWLDQVLDLLHGNGIKVNLATPTASPPPWFSLAHPDALPVTADGVRLMHGSRDTYCVSAPAYREAAVGIARVLGERYRDHPALAMWHVHNEYGSTCHCDHVAASFRTWLQRRYGELGALNAAWTTAFWSQGYSAWEQVFPPRRTQYLPNPSQMLDFRRFLSDELLTAYQEQKSVLRALTPDIPITTNFVFGAWVPVDHWRWSREVDLVAIDHYPGSAGIEAEQQTAFGADLARSWGGGRWLLMEQAAGSFNVGGRLHSKEPGRMARNSVSHIARGSSGALFFQWRASQGGAERFHSGMVPHAGADSRAFREITELGELLPRLAEADSAEVEAEVAILWDAESWWATDGPALPSPAIDYLAAVQAAHRQLWQLGIGTDFAHPTADLTAYRVVVVPSLYLAGAEVIASINQYAASGGQLLITALSGIADETTQIRLGGYPGAFRELLGIRVEEFLPVDGTIELDTGELAEGWSERVLLEGAEAIARYQGGVLDGWPAITRRDNVWYSSTWLTDPAYRSLMTQVVHAAGITPAELPAGIEVITRRSADARYRYILNHTAGDVRLPYDGIDLITGEQTDGEVTVAAGGWTALRTKPAEQPPGESVAKRNQSITGC
ncbi:beta-galactosidase [Kribbella voronezhensis]|uniref:Beta-galactosidase n=1 Tax=Kribbella voronezhensis TaxID=2512212 RepID=A0A4V3FIQ7_9ACTN|nr:beta-galactosidase [Kribbella voronezhensis]TDU83383.1 beta-galactosidase [Kribbella voronezhensis]